MQSPAYLDWWPERRLRQLPVRKVFVCGRKLDPPPYSHVVNFARLEIPIRGCYENRIETNGQLITARLHPGSVLFAPPNCWNLPAWRQNVEVISLLFGKKHLGISHVTGRSTRDFQLAAQKFSTPWPLTGPLPLILEAMVELQSAGKPQEAFVMLSQALICCVEELLLRHPTARTSTRAQGLLESVCVYLQNHYQYDITRDSVAQQFNVTPSHLSRLFKTHGSMSFSNYLTHVRIDRAKHLLRSYNLKIDDISMRCGYRDTPYFYRVFKQHTKVTPAEYRTALQAEAVNSLAAEHGTIAASEETIPPASTLPIRS